MNVLDEFEVEYSSFTIMIIGVSFNTTFQSELPANLLT